jgi:hypothetical protein
MNRELGPLQTTLRQQTYDIKCPFVKRTCQAGLMMSVDRGRPKVTGGRPKRRERPTADLHRSEVSHRSRPEQRLVIRFDGPVAFADRFMQASHIGYLYMTPRIFYHSSLLKRARMQRHAGSPDAQHLSKKFLGELQTVSPR